MLYTLPKVMKCDDQAGLQPIWINARYLGLKASLSEGVSG